MKLPKAVLKSAATGCILLSACLSLGATVLTFQNASPIPIPSGDFLLISPYIQNTLLPEITEKGQVYSRLNELVTAHRVISSSV